MNILYKFVGTKAECAEMYESMQPLSARASLTASKQMNAKNANAEEHNSQQVQLKKEMKDMCKKYDDLSSLLNQEYQKSAEMENQIKSLKETNKNTFCKFSKTITNFF
jgi:protein-arginine kinase activator protein McsA